MANPWRHRWLLWTFVRRDLRSRYAGSAGGALWTLLHPLALLAVYAFVFSGVFRVKLPPEFGAISYTAFVAVTLWPWLMFAEGVERGMAAVHENAGLIRKVAFPHQLVVISAVASTFAVHLAGYLAVLAVLRALGEPIALRTAGWALVLLSVLMIVTIGIASALAAIQAMLSDFKQVIGIMLALLFYATPVLYPSQLVPTALKDWASLNPLAWVAERLREILLSGSGPGAGDGAIVLVAAVTLIAGTVLFRRLSPYFEDFL